MAGRLPFNAFADGRTLVTYVLLHVGLSTGAGGSTPGDRKARRGVNVGLLLGVELEVQSGFALYLEAGWQMHPLRYRSMGLREDWVANQAVIHVGLRAAR